MRRIVGIATAFAALLGITNLAAEEAERIGAWKVGRHPEDSSRCVMGTAGDDGSALFGTRTRPKPEIVFMFAGKDFQFAPSKEMNSGIEVLVDGRPVRMRSIPSVGDDVVGFFDAQNQEGRSELLAAFEEGDHVVVQTQGRRSTFDLAQTREAVAALTRCENGGEIAQSNGEVGSGTTATAPAKVANSPSSGETPALNGKDGDWHVYPSEPYFPSGCFATRSNSDGAIFLLHQERPQAGVSFGVGSQEFNLVTGWKGPAELVVDGQSFRFIAIRGFDTSTLFSAVASDSADFIDRMRTGTMAEFEFEGRAFRFDLKGFAEALPTFADCVAANDRTFASVLSGNRTNRALGITLAAEDEADLGSPEAAGDEEKPNEPFDADAVAALLNREQPHTQLRCSIPAINFVGLYGAESRAIDFDIAIYDDATAYVQGTKITPVAHRAATADESPSVGIYRANEVYGAITRSPLADLLADAPRGPEGAFEERFLEMMTNPGSMVPDNRLLSVSLLNDEVTVADQMSDGQIGNMSTHRCFRLR